MGLHTSSERELRDRRVVIYQRTDTVTAVWQCRIIFPRQPNIRRSLKIRCTRFVVAKQITTVLFSRLNPSYKNASAVPI
jgi:hypothetical protein